MRCARVDSLLDRHVDGLLEPGLAAELAAHVEGCTRCAARLREAREIAAALASTAPVKAPRGFLENVMNGVYREAMAGGPRAASELARREPGRAGFYRRLGFSLVASAAVLAVSLLIPRGSYPALMKGAQSAAFSEAGPSIVKNVLAGAGRAVQGTLGERGSHVETQGGDAR